MLNKEKKHRVKQGKIQNFDIRPRVGSSNFILMTEDLSNLGHRRSFGLSKLE